MKIPIYFLLSLFLIVSCVDNPNLSEEAYLDTDNPTKSWIVGLQRQLALTLNSATVYTEMVSDNYLNNYTSYSKVFDIPEILYSDADVNTFQSRIGALREMAEYGLEKVIPADSKATDDDKSYMYFCKAYALLLAGENFIGLPETSNGSVVEWEVLLEHSLEYLDMAIQLVSDNSTKQAYTLLKARIYRNLGETEKAKTYANQVINQTDLLYQVEFDGENDVTNEMQYACFSATQNMFAPLPRLDFLDPKYYDEGTSQTQQKPISIIKAEEAYLILSEVYLAKNNFDSVRYYLSALITNVVNNRAIAYIDDSGETRSGSVRNDYPTTAVKVKFSSSDSLRSGYVLNRQAGDIKVYTISGTKVTTDEINGTNTEDGLLYLIYRLRQEILFGEGRRMCDLGIRFPVSQTEQLNNSNVTSEYTNAVIPSFIPLNYGLDDFTVDAVSGDITMRYDMNAVLVENKSSDYVLPFNN